MRTVWSRRVRSRCSRRSAPHQANGGPIFRRTAVRRAAYRAAFSMIATILRNCNNVLIFSFVYKNKSQH